VEPANLKLIVIFQLCDCFTVFLFYEVNSFKQALAFSWLPWPGNLLFATIVITNHTSEKEGFSAHWSWLYVVSQSMLSYCEEITVQRFQW